MALDPIYEPIQLGSHIVPGIWRYMLPEDVFYFRVDPEKLSSCFDCPQVKAHGFHPSVRCCTYIPRVPNFLLGMALQDPATSGLVKHFIEAGFAIPEGSQFSPEQLSRSLQQLTTTDRSQPLIVCPFLDQASKRCQIYAYRSGVCSTFFCIHDQGEEGAHFWEQLQDLVTQVETALSQWALQEIGFDLEAYFERFNALGSQLESGSDPHSFAWSVEARKHLFREWFGREQELYTSCADLIIRNKQDLYSLAGQQKLQQTKGYDEALRQSLAGKFPAHQIAESLPEGDPVSIKNIWYGVQLAHRNLQLSRSQSPP